MAYPAPSPALSGHHLSRLYTTCLHAADCVHAHRFLAGSIGACLVFALITTINQFVLLDFPNSGDEYAYLYQAKTVAAGRLWNPPVTPPEVFSFNYIVQEPHRTFGSFPIGWPTLALTPMVALGGPAWLVNAVLGVVTVGLVWVLGARLYTPRVGVLAASLVAVSPFFAFNAASYFSHTFCGALLLGAACLAARKDRGPWWVPASIGLLVGWAVLARYVTGLICAMPILLWLLRPGVNRTRAAWRVILGGLPWVAVLMIYNTMLSGSPWRLTTTQLTISRWFADGFLLRGADILATHLLRHVLWTPPALIATYLVYLRVAPADTRRGAFDWLPVLMAGILYFYVERGGNQYGPRFHYEVFLFLTLFVAANAFRETHFVEKSRRDRVLFALLAASVALMPVSFLGHAIIERQVVEERMDPYTSVANAGLSRALVLIEGRVGTVRSMAARDLTRNGIEHRASVIYGIDPGEGHRCRPDLQLPGRTTYLYSWDPAASRGLLRPVTCP